MLLLASCTLRDVMPGPPVMGAAEREAFVVSGHADVKYDGAPVVTFPVLPVQVWGLQYALDVVLVSQHPDWVMHEYARIDTPSGPIWLAKDAGTDREQTIVSPLPGIESWAAEVPIHRISGPLDVRDNSHDDLVDIGLAYTNALGQAVTVHYSGLTPVAPSHPRNGNTMGHSRNAVAALLDLYRFRVGGAAEITIGGQPQKLHRLLGVIPEAYILGQTQAGFATANFVQEPATATSFMLRRPGSAEAWPTSSAESWGIDGPHVVRVGALTKLDYVMPNGEMTGATVRQTGVGEVMRLALATPLPDLRRHFPGTISTAFVIDVGGQSAHGKGSLSAHWEDETTVVVDMVPTKPRWFADRPMQTRISYVNGTALVDIRRVPTAAEVKAAEPKPHR